MLHDVLHCHHPLNALTQYGLLDNLSKMQASILLTDIFESLLLEPAVLLNRSQSLNIEITEHYKLAKS